LKLNFDLKNYTVTAYFEKCFLYSDLHQACQTFQGGDMFTQTSSEKAVQMDRDDYYVSQSRDYVLYPKTYKNFDSKEGERDVAVC